MNKKTQFIITLLIILSMASFSYNENIKGKLHEESKLKYNETNSPLNNTSILVYFCRSDGTFYRNVKTLSKNVYNSFIHKLSNISNLEISLSTLFEQKLQIMKDYGIIPEEISINDVIKTSRILNASKINFSFTHARSFVSHFAPIFI